jgi:hypothetical protein
MLAIIRPSPLLRYGVAVPVVGAANRNGRGEKVGLHSEPGRGTTVEAEVELPEMDHDG